MNIRFFAIAALVSSVAAFGQTNDGGFQVRYASNLAVGDSVINLTNDGASSTAGDATMGAAQNGNLCVNVYAYTPDEQMASCCTCIVTPNGLNSLSVRSDLASNPLTPVIPSAMVIKLVATKGDSTNTCNAAKWNGTGNVAEVIPGLMAWGTTIHALPVTPGTPATTYGVIETAFSVGSGDNGAGKPSTAEATRMQQLCGFIKANGSGYGICKSCRLGGLGSSSK
jgi:hypothetical protein